MHSRNYNTAAPAGVSHMWDGQDPGQPYPGSLVDFRTGEVWSWYEQQRFGGQMESPAAAVAPAAGDVAAGSVVELPAALPQVQAAV